MEIKTERQQAIKAHSRRCPWDIDTATPGRTTPSSATALAAAMLYGKRYVQPKPTNNLIDRLAK